jgi:hypothetical protein
MHATHSYYPHVLPVATSSIHHPLALPHASPRVAMSAAVADAACAATAATEPPPPLTLVLPRLDARSLATCACVSTSWRALVTNAWSHISLDGEAAAGKALRRLAAARPSLLAKATTLSLEFARNITDEDLAAALPASCELREVNLNATQAVGDQAILTVAACCSHLERLSLYWNVRVTDAAITALCASPCAASLASLNLSGCKRLTRLDAVASLPALTQLDVTRCLALTDAALLALARGCNAARLTSLVLYADSQFSASSLSQLLSALGRTSLARLDLCGASHLDDAALGCLGSHPDVDVSDGLALVTLNLTWCPLLSGTSLVPLLRRCTRLRWLSLHGNTHITEAVLGALEQSCAATLEALDVRGCTAIPAASRTQAALLARFPRLRDFALHS